MPCWLRLGRVTKSQERDYGHQICADAAEHSIHSGYKLANFQRLHQEVVGSQLSLSQKSELVMGMSLGVPSKRH